MKPMNVVVVDEFVAKGESEPRKIYTTVGVAFPHKTGGGYTLKIRKNISLSGEVHLFPVQERRDREAGRQEIGGFDSSGDEESFPAGGAW